MAQQVLTAKYFNAHSLVLVLFAFNPERVTTTMNGKINVSADRASLCKLGERARAIYCSSRPSIGLIRPNDFVFARKVCSLKPAGWKTLITAFERRLEHVITHPFFGLFQWEDLLRYSVGCYSVISRERLPNIPTTYHVRQGWQESACMSLHMTSQTQSLGVMHSDC